MVMDSGECIQGSLGMFVSAYNMLPVGVFMITRSCSYSTAHAFRVSREALDWHV